MLNSTPDEIQGHQRLRWKVISGWKWLGRQEHINSLELRACLACLRRRLEHLRNHDCRILHLTDSLVRLHSMTRGRTSKFLGFLKAEGLELPRRRELCTLWSWST